MTAVLGAPLVGAAPQDGQDAACFAETGQGWRWAELDLDVWIEAEYGDLFLQGAGRLVLQAEASSGPRVEINGSLLEFASVAVSGASVELGTRMERGHPVATARVRCAVPQARGAEIRIEFECRSKGRSDQFAVSDKAALASWTQAWYPLPFNGPDALQSRQMEAPGLTRFHLPPGWHSVSNGERVDSHETEVEVWRVSSPVARSFACAPYEVIEQDVGGRLVAVHRLSPVADPADVELRAVAGILRVLEERYGPYPYPSYRVAEVPLGVGDFLGSSEQGFIMVRPVAFDAPDGNLALFGHELAHGWWGNRVGSSGPGSILLDEALSQFSAFVAIEALEGEAAATDFLRFSRPGYVTEQCARGFFDLVRGGRDRPLSTLPDGDGHLLSDCKGHWVYHMLRQTIGDERFFATLRGVIRDFYSDPLTLPELRARFVRAAPDEGLEQFFAQWLDQPGAPVLEHEWSDEAGRAAVTIRQLQPGEPYHLALEVAVDSAAGRQVALVELCEREQRFVLESDGPPTGVVLDPRHRLLTWTSDYGPRPTQ
jgi:aminopeptidase N